MLIIPSASSKCRYKRPLVSYMCLISSQHSSCVFGMVRSARVKDIPKIEG
jgi:hypothetical protein